MKKTAISLFPPLLVLALAVGADLPTAYKSGTIQIVPDPAFGAKTEWDTLFKVSTDKWTAFLPDGTFFRTAAADGKVYKFDSDGNLLKSFGRKGQGPGDLQSPGALDVVEGKALVVNDAGNGRLSFFDLEGNFLKTARLGGDSGPPLLHLSLIALDKDRFAYAAHESRKSPPTVIAARYRVLIKDLATGQEAEVAAFDWERPRSKFMVRVIEWEPAVYLAKAGPDRLLVSCSGSPEVAFYSPTGKKISSFNVNVEKMNVTWKHLEFVMRAEENPKNFVFVAQNKADIGLPEFLPLYSQLALNPEGNILVYDYNPARLSRDASFKVYSQDGKLIAAVKIDPAEYEPVQPVHFWKNYAYAYLVRKDDGSFTFGRFKIHS
jgi:hypothetical protein